MSHWSESPMAGFTRPAMPSALTPDYMARFHQYAKIGLERGPETCAACRLAAFLLSRHAARNVHNHAQHTRSLQHAPDCVRVRAASPPGLPASPSCAGFNVRQLRPAVGALNSSETGFRTHVRPNPPNVAISPVE